MRETIMMKGLMGYSNSLFALGLLGTVFYPVRELIAVLVIFSVGFAALFLIAVAFLLCLHVTDRAPDWLRKRVPQRNRTSRDWMVAMFRSEQTAVLVAANVRLPRSEATPTAG